MPYYEITSKKLKDAVNQWIAARQAAYSKQSALSRRLGGHKTSTMQLASSLGDDHWGVIFKTPPDTKTWKQPKGVTDYWLPRLGTKAGKAIATEMDSLNAPGIGVLAKIIKMNQFQCLMIATPGISRLCERLIVSVYDDYKPIAGMKRISDVAVERLREQSKRTPRKKK